MGFTRARRVDLPLALHGATVVAGTAFWAWTDRKLWFFGDEWDFLTRGLWHSPASPSGIFYPHNEHWSTLPILLWRALFSIFHLGSYWPYLVPLLVVQALTVHLAWRLALRSGASPWVAAAAAGLLAFLGAGAEDLTWAFQIGFVGSVMFGLLACELLERASLRLACACLVAALMCSTIGVAMVAGAAVLAARRLPWRRWITVSAPPTAIYIIWFLGVGHLGLAAHSDTVDLRVLSAAPGYAWDGISGALGQVVGAPALGGALLVALGVWLGANLEPLWRRAPVALALVAAALAFYLLAGIGRDATTVSPTVSRYIYVCMALVVPALAAALSGRTRRPLASMVAVGLLALTTLGNIGQAETAIAGRDVLVSQLKTTFFATAHWLRQGVHYVSGPSAPSIPQFPNLASGQLAAFVKKGWVGHISLTPLDLSNARALLAVGTWAGSQDALTARPLFREQFSVVRSSVPSRRGAGGCISFAPGAVSVWLKVGGTGRGASVRVVVPYDNGVIQSITAGIVPRRGPASTQPVPLAIGGRATGYFDDNYPGSTAVLTWTGSGALALCGARWH